MTDYEVMRSDLSRLTMRELKEIAKREGICLGYDGSRKENTVEAIVSQRRHRELDHE